MKVGIVLPLFSGSAERVLEAAREAQEMGYDGAFVFDHFFPPGASRDRPALEAFTTLAAVAVFCDRLTIGTLVTRASIRPTGLLAKTAAWIDAMTGGRLVIGIGTGDPIDQPEHDAYGIPSYGRDDRRAHLEETVVALKALFEGGAYPGGRFVPELAGPLLPAPARAGGPPIWLGAQAEPVIRMAGRVADGWNGWGLDPGRFRTKAAILEDAAGEAGRTVEATWAGITLVGADEAESRELAERRAKSGMQDQAWTGSADELAGRLGDLAEAGAAWAVLVPAGPRDRAALIAEKVLPQIPRQIPR